MKSVRQIAYTVAVMAMCVALSVGSVVAQTGGNLTEDQETYLYNNSKLRKFFIELGSQYPYASDALLLEAAEELFYDGEIVGTKRALEATQGRRVTTDLNDVISEPPRMQPKQGTDNPPLIVTDNDGFPPGFVELPGGNLSLDDLGLTSAFYTYTVAPSQEGGDGFIVYEFDNGLLIAVNGDGERRLGFLNLVIPWPWGTNERRLK